MGKVDIAAARKWSTLPRDLQRKLIENVFCSRCHITTIVDYDILDDKFGVLLQGQCKKCGQAVARLVEIDA